MLNCKHTFFMLGLIMMATYVTAARLTESQILSPDDSDLVNHPDRIAYFNSLPNRTWTAVLNPRFDNMTFGDVKRMLLSDEPDRSSHTRRKNYYVPGTNASNGNLTEDSWGSFDARKQWPGYVSRIHDQGTCNDCWAVTEADSFSDRVSIAWSQKKAFSAADFVACTSIASKGYCGGAYPPTATDHVVKVGLVTESCFPSGDDDGNSKMPPKTCRLTCADGAGKLKDRRVRASASYDIKDFYVRKAFIKSVGPAHGGFKYYPSLPHCCKNEDDVYKPASGEEPDGRHSVRIVGWGSIEGWFSNTDYWTIANSWGSKFGVGGYFKMEKAACGIDDLVDMPRYPQTYCQNSGPKPCPDGRGTCC